MLKKSTLKTVFVTLLSAGFGVSCESPDGVVTTESIAGLIEGQYIVVLKDPASANARLSGSYSARTEAMHQEAAQLLSQFRIDPAVIDQTYSTALRGFAGRLTAAQVNQLRKSPDVAYIEQDRYMITDAPERIDEEAGSRVSAAAAGQETPWGITAVGGSVNYTGQASAWVIDTGIDLDHPDLNVDVNRGKNFVTTGAGAKTLDDQHGHGSHMAGIIAAKNNTFGVVGIAAGAPVIPVKVSWKFEETSVSAFVAGADYVTANAKPGDVVNISLAAQNSTAADDAVRRMAQSGNIFIAISAGNSDKVKDANQMSPGRVNAPNIFTASAYDSKGVFAPISCSGNPPIDFSAPGIKIKSTANNGTYATFAQGTSMSTAHLCGILLANNGVIYGKGFVTKDRDTTPDAKGSRVP